MLPRHPAQQIKSAFIRHRCRRSPSQNRLLPPAHGYKRADSPVLSPVEVLPSPYFCLPRFSHLTDRREHSAHSPTSSNEAHRHAAGFARAFEPHIQRHQVPEEGGAAERCHQPAPSRNADPNQAEEKQTPTAAAALG
jgi:hypothetical protein